MTGLLPQSSKSQRESIAALARLALRYSGADGYCLYALEHSSGALVAHSSAGCFLPEPDDLTLNPGTSTRDGRTVRSFPLRVAGSVVGILAFSVRTEAIPENQLALLDRMAKSIETLFCLPYLSAQLFARVNELESDIAASKISARSEGLLEDGAQTDAIPIIENHVNTVLRSSRLWSSLQQLLRDGEEELTQRKVASRAKTVLQRVHGMTEEQAYHYLRIASRRTRKPVREVANHLLAGGALLPIEPPKLRPAARPAILQ